LSTRVADARVERAGKEATAGAADLRDPAKRGAAIDALEQQMKEAAANLEFEVAATLRDHVIELRAIDGPNLDRESPRDRQRA
jgi:excinuclease UvrABC helicase subunit UvrB